MTPTTRWPARPRSRAARAARTVAELRRRAHQHELQGRDAGGAFVVRVSGARTPACSPSTARTSTQNSVARGRRPVSARRSSTTCRSARCWCSGSSRARRRAPGTCARGDRLDWVAAACRRLHGARAVSRRLQHVRDPARATSSSSRTAGSGCRTRYLEFEPQVRRIRGGAGRARRGHRALQQRPARRELHRRRRRVPADRLRVLGQQRRLLRARQHLERVEPVARPARRAHRGLLRRAAAPTRSPARASGGSCRSTAGRSGPRSRTASRDIDFDFWTWGMEKYDRAVAEFDGPDFDRLIDDVQRPD